MKKNLKVLQEEISDCGVCSLLSIIRYYGGDTNLEKLRIETSTSKKGVSALDLVECAINYGFDAKGLKLKNINDVNLPCIAHIKVNDSLSHFVVVYKVENDTVVLMDPSSGFKKLNISLFNKSFTGVVITLFPKTIISKEKRSNYCFKNTLSYIFKYKKIFLKIIFLNLIFITLSIINSFYIEFISNTKSIFNIYLVFLSLIVAINILHYYITNSHEKLKNKISISIMNNFFRHILFLPLKYIHLKDSSEIIKRTNDLEGVESIIVDAIVVMFTNVFIILFCLLTILFISKPIMFILLLFIFVYIFVGIILNKNITTLLNQVIDVSTKYNSKLMDDILGITSIHHNYLFEKVYSNLSKCKKEDLDVLYKYKRKITRNSTVLETLFQILVISVYTYALYSNSLTLTLVIVLSFIINLVNDSLKDIASLIPGLFYSKSIIRKIDDFYSINMNSNGSLITDSYDLVIDNLNFGYNKINNIIDNLSIRINKGEKVIIKGESGKGKSTLCKILNKELSYKGSIKLGDVELSNINNDNFRTKITYSAQDEYIFNGSIKDNILLGRKVSDEEFERIASICCLDRIIRNRPFKYDTYLYEGGKELSGGERNLIILARALVNKSNIYIFDETLRELNDAVENKVLSNIFEYYKDNTIIYVSHKNKKNYFGRVIYV